MTLLKWSGLRNWAADQTTAILHQQGIVARYNLDVQVIPLALELTNVRVDSVDGGDPLLFANRVTVRPRLFSLLNGKFTIDHVDIDSPRIRVVLRSGKLVNLPIELPKSEPDPTNKFEVPFNVFAVTDASIDLDVDGARLFASDIDIDVSAESEGSGGSILEIALHAGKARFQLARVVGDKGDQDNQGGTAPTVHVDDDALCFIDARLRYEPNRITVRRFTATGSVDLDPFPDTTPRCDLDLTDKRRVEVEMNYVRVFLPPTHDDKLRVDARRIRARAPLALAQRAVSLPETDGWIGLDLGGQYTGTTMLPEISGTLEAHDIKLDHFRFAQEIHADFAIQRDIIRSKSLVVRIADGEAALSNVVVKDLARGGAIEASAMLRGINFTSLMRDLGVHPHSYVAWDIKDISLPKLRGTFVPLKLDADFVAHTTGFAIYDHPATDPARARLFGLGTADITAHLAVRPNAVEFQRANVRVGGASHVEGAFVSLGFDEQIRAEVPHAHVDLADITPVGAVHMGGKADLEFHMGGKFSHPTPEGEIRNFEDFSVADLRFGNLSSGRFKLDVSGPVLDLSGVRAKKGASPYEVPSVRLDFGRHGGGFVVDALATSTGLGLRDLFAMFKLEDDPRFEGLDAKLATRGLARVHVAIGGPEDRCRGGLIQIETRLRTFDMNLFGERFDQGEAELRIDWTDRRPGLVGADIEVPSLLLVKRTPEGASGTIAGSAALRTGGALSANFVIEGIPIASLNSLSVSSTVVDGRISGVAQAQGTLDEFSQGGFTVEADVDVTPVRIRRRAVLGKSRVHLTMTDAAAQTPVSDDKSGCGRPIGRPFDKKAFLADRSSRGSYTVDGTLLDGQVRLRKVSLTRAKAPVLTGRVEVRALDLGTLYRALHSPERAGETSSSEFSGEIWGDLALDDVPLRDLANARARYFPGVTVIETSGARLALVPPKLPVLVQGDMLTLPGELEARLQTSAGLSSGVRVTGGLQDLSKADPQIGVRLVLDPLDLSVVPKFVPKVERASGTVRGEVTMTGSLQAPKVSGEFSLRADDLDIRGLQGGLSDVVLDAKASEREIEATGSASLAGGTLAFRAAVPLRGFAFGNVDAMFGLRNISLTPADGISATLDADLAMKIDTSDPTVLPHLRGEITLKSFDYTRPIVLASDFASLGGRTKRTVVESYDPSLDTLTFDLRLTARQPLRVRNNLVDLSLGIDSNVLEVSGTNQRFGLRGGLKTNAGGRFRFRSNDFDIRQGLIRFDDPTRISPNVDVVAVTEYRRSTDSSAGASSVASAGVAGVGSSRGGALWRIALHAYGDTERLRLDLTSEPPLSQEDLLLLLTVGMTRAELDQLQAGSLGASLALNYLGAASGADRLVREAIPLIDDFRFGSAYSLRTGRTEPQLTLGKRITDSVRATVTTGIAEDRQVRSDIEWRLGQRFSVQGSYDNVYDVTSSSLGNVGVDLRYRLEFR